MLERHHIDSLITVARQAGDIIMEVFHQDTIPVNHKKDASPVTEADERAEKAILPVLRRITPQIPIIAEESFTTKPEIPNSNEPFWLVDALDGTKEFIRKGHDFTVNIALVARHSPIIGVIYCPVPQLMFVADGLGTSKQIFPNGQQRQLHVQKAESTWRVLGSKNHKTPETETYLQNVPIKTMMAHSSSLKFCLLATGEADFYPRLGPTMEWDTAAGHAILAGAGGTVTHMDGRPFTYGKPGFRNGAFLAAGGIEAANIPFSPSIIP